MTILKTTSRFVDNFLTSAYDKKVNVILKLFKSLFIVGVIVSIFMLNATLVGADLGDAANGTVGGNDGGYTDGSGPSLGGGDASYDPSQSSVNNSVTTDASGDSSVSNSFYSYINDIIGLGNEAGITSNPGGPAPLSNQNATLDQNGVTSTYDSTDTGYNCQQVNCNDPALNATATCVGNQPVVDLYWGGNTTNLRHWHLLRAQEPNPVFNTYGIFWHTEGYRRDWNVSPFQIYYYGIYGSNASGDFGNYSYTGRTPLSNIMAVYTPGCGAPSPVPQPPPVAPISSINLISNTCNASGSLATFGFTTDASVPEMFHLDKNNNYVGTAFPDNPVLGMQLNTGETASFSMRVQLGGIIYNGSNSVSVSALGCTDTSPPVVNLNITTNQGIFPANGLPVTVRIGEPVTINWSVIGADTITAVSAPSKADWNGSKVNTGTEQLATSAEGIYVLSLKGTNTLGETNASIQLNIISNTNPYIQTTQGDVHSNNNILMPR